MRRHIGLGRLLEKPVYPRGTVDEIVRSIVAGTFEEGLTNLVHHYSDFALIGTISHVGVDGLLSSANPCIANAETHPFHVVAMRSLGEGYIGEKFVLSIDDVRHLLSTGYFVEGSAVQDFQKEVVQRIRDDDSQKDSLVEPFDALRMEVLDYAPEAQRERMQRLFDLMDANEDGEMTIDSIKAIGLMDATQIESMIKAFDDGSEDEPPTEDDFARREAMAAQFEALPAEGVQRFWIGIDAWTDDYPAEAPFFYWVTGSAGDLRFRDEMVGHPRAQWVRDHLSELADNQEFALITAFFHHLTTLTMLVDAKDEKAAWEQVVEQFPTARERFVLQRQEKTLDGLSGGGRFQHPTRADEDVSGPMP